MNGKRNFKYKAIAKVMIAVLLIFAILISSIPALGSLENQNNVTVAAEKNKLNSQKSTWLDVPKIGADAKANLPSNDAGSQTNGGE